MSASKRSHIRSLAVSDTFIRSLADAVTLKTPGISNKHQERSESYGNRIFTTHDCKQEKEDKLKIETPIKHIIYIQLSQADTQHVSKKIWLNSFRENKNTQIAYLDDLYPHLMKEFKRSTKCNKQQPTIEEIQVYFVRTGGEVFNLHVEYLTFGYVRLTTKYMNLFENKSMSYESSLNFIICSYLGNMHFLQISKDMFENFFAWFASMCGIVKDLRAMYDRDDDPLIALFYGRTFAEDALKDKPVGTFLLRLASQQNGLAITYKTTEKIQNILLTRTSNEMYKIGKTDRKTLLFNLIRPWDKLQYLYTPNKLVRKALVF
eukprot:795068_1